MSHSSVLREWRLGPYVLAIGASSRQPSVPNQATPFSSDNE